LKIKSKLARSRRMRRSGEERLLKLRPRRKKLAWRHSELRLKLHKLVRGSCSVN